MSINRRTFVKAVGGLGAALIPAVKNTSAAVLPGVNDALVEKQSFKSILGKNSNLSEALNIAISEIAPTGNEIFGEPGIYNFKDPIRLASGTRLNLSKNCTVQKDFKSQGNDSALMSNINWSEDINDIEIKGGLFRPRSQSDCGGILFSIYGDNIALKDMQAFDWYSGQAFVFGGNNLVLSNIYAASAVTEYGTGTYRCVGGNNGIFSNLYGEGGDDIFQFVPITNPRNSRFGLSISNMTYQYCIGRSHSARLCIASLTGPQALKESKMSNNIKNVSFRHISGTGGKRCVSIENTHSSGEINHVDLDHCLINGAYDKSNADQSVKIDGLSGDVKNVNISDSKIFNNKRSAILVRRCENLSINKSLIESNEAAIKTQESSIHVKQSIVSGANSSFDLIVVGARKAREKKSRLCVSSDVEIRTKRSDPLLDRTCS